MYQMRDGSEWFNSPFSYKLDFSKDFRDQMACEMKVHEKPNITDEKINKPARKSDIKFS